MVTFLELGKWGRLGNQMFQIASTLGIAKRNAMTCLFQPWEYADRFQGMFPAVSWLGECDWKDYTEPNTGYNEIDLDRSHHWNLKGYFQSWRYFENIRGYIYYLFDFGGGPTLPYTSIHVRRGDYEGKRDIHPDPGAEYYGRAMWRAGGKFLVFSDDLQWCRQRMGGVEFCEEADPIKAMHLMSRCENNIIANSSFSWWAAYLNRNPGRLIIAPPVYVAGEANTLDRYPPEWIVL